MTSAHPRPNHVKIRDNQDGSAAHHGVFGRHTSAGSADPCTDHGKDEEVLTPCRHCVEIGFGALFNGQRYVE